MSAIGLNDNHQNEIVNYLRFARYNRSQTVKSIDSCFSDVKDSRLIDDTYTIDEVIEILEGLCGVVKGEIELELTNASHTNVLLLRQLFSQAEKWHLKLQADISELENRKLLEEIAQFEENEFSASKSKSVVMPNLSQKSKLQPLNEGGNTALLQMEISKLQEENAKLKERAVMLEKKATDALDEKTKLSSDLSKARIDLNSKGDAPIKVDDRAIQDLTEKVSTLNQELKDAENIAKRKCSSTVEELANTKHYVLALQHEVELLNKEVDKKFSETSQYKNLKKMLETKNVQIKDLRARIKRYEPNAEV